MHGIDKNTGRPLSGFDHVVQHIHRIFLSSFGDWPLARYYGSFVPVILGRNVSRGLLIRFFSAIVTAIELFEPRFKIKSIKLNDITRSGEMSFTLTGIYRPLALYGDFTEEGQRGITIASSDSVYTAREIV